ncbi:redoxin domain-containing protein [Candidatus Gottesmanbacteria bacterium]|nr:redoxin domain-containing protein [Candidatus Gottesmanbacteria bacterium]
MKRIIARIFFVFFLLVLSRPGVAYADNSCSVSVSPQIVRASSSSTLTFSVSNSSSVASHVQYRVVGPNSGNFTITSGSASGWTISLTSSTEIAFSGGSTGAGSTGTISVIVSAADTETNGESWEVLATSNEESGATEASCGLVSVGIFNQTASGSGLSLSAIGVRSSSTTEAKIEWTSSVAADSTLDYGTSDSYGSTKTDGTLATSHSFTLTGLTAATTYHYRVKSTDALGNQSQSGDGTFKTNSNTTYINVATPTPTPTPVPDREGPVIKIATNLTKPFSVAPEISGSATDRTGISSIEYSIDGGKNFTPVDDLSSPGKKSSAFSFTPGGLIDDDYALVIRGTDTLGNVSKSRETKFVFDRLPPQAGGSVLTLGSQVIEPVDDGTLILVSGLSYKLTLSSIGGATASEIRIKDHAAIPLTKNIENGLWSTALLFDNAGEYTLSVYSKDGAGNETTRDLMSLRVIPGGSVSASGVKNTPIQDAKVSVYVRDTETNQFSLWDAPSYGQSNPAKTDAAGQYHLSLPPGTYYLSLDATGYKTVLSEIFTLSNFSPVTTPFFLSPRMGIAIGPFVFAFPDFPGRPVPVLFNSSLSDAPNRSSIPSEKTLIGQEFPYFDFPLKESRVTSLSIRGKPMIVSLVNSWMPQTAGQLSVLESLAKKKELGVLVMIPQESASKVSLFGKRAAYSFPIVADPDGTLVEKLSIQSLPLNLFVDRKGVIRSVVSGVRNREQLLDMIIQ